MVEPRVRPVSEADDAARERAFDAFVHGQASPENLARAEAMDAFVHGNPGAVMTPALRPDKEAWA
jgi:hypothetical protein